MRKALDYIRSSLLNGFFVLAPIYIFVWAIEFIFTAAKPISEKILLYAPGKEIHEGLVGIIALLCLMFLVGSITKIRFGSFHPWNYIEEKTIGKIPLYDTMKNALSRLFKISKKNEPFLQGAYVRLGENNVLTLTLISAKCPELGKIAVFMPLSLAPPLGPNYMLDEDRVYPLDYSFKETMEVMLSGGTGGEKLMENCAKKYPHLFKTPR